MDVKTGIGGGLATGDIYDLYRKASNIGGFKDLNELMQLKHIKI